MNISLKSLFLVVFASLTVVSCSTYDEYYKSALAGDAHAQYMIGSCYDDGDGGVPGGKADKGQAAIWYRKAAEQGYAKAQNNLGILYKRGEGVPQSYEEAAKWYEKAAQQGNQYAQFNLGNLIETLYSFDYETDSPEHEKIARASEQAAYWYRLAAEQGNSGAQYKLARLYDTAACENRESKKVFINLGGNYRDTAAYRAEAEKWYKKAASQGHEQAARDYEQFKKTGSGVIVSVSAY